MDRNLGALIIMIVGMLLFFYTMNLWFWGSILVLIASVGTVISIVASGEKEDRIRRMEDRIKELEEAQRIRETNNKEKEDT